MKFKCAGYLTIQQHAVYLDEMPPAMHMLDFDGIYEFKCPGTGHWSDRQGAAHGPERVDGPVLVMVNGGESYFYGTRKKLCLEIEPNGTIARYERSGSGFFRKMILSKG